MHDVTSPRHMNGHEISHLVLGFTVYPHKCWYPVRYQPRPLVGDQQCHAPSGRRPEEVAWTQGFTHGRRFLVPRQRKFYQDLAVINGCLDELISLAKDTREADDIEALQARDYANVRRCDSCYNLLPCLLP